MHHYSKSQIFVQKFNLDNFFSVNQSCQQLKSPKPQHFHEFFTQNNFYREIKVEFLENCRIVLGENFTKSGFYCISAILGKRKYLIKPTYKTHTAAVNIFVEQRKGVKCLRQNSIFKDPKYLLKIRTQCTLIKCKTFPDRLQRDYLCPKLKV